MKDNLGRKRGFYERFIKRPQDFILSFLAIIGLSPIMLVLAIVGAITMKGNPFFVQKRPGMINKKTGKEKIISLLKFRTMTNERDSDGNLLPDEKRLNKYGRFLRSTSLDELPSLINILIGDIAIVGPRPLLVEYLERYNERQARRHEVRPGLTGYAQVYGRNSITWEEKFEKDVYYVDNISFLNDWNIIFKTVVTVFKKEGITSQNSATMEVFLGTECLEDENV